MKETYVGGVKDASAQLTLSNGVAISAQGHALIDQHDVGADVSVKKDGLGVVNVDYDEFRKYYDKTGGTYYRFGTLSASDTFRDLALDIGKFGMETGLTLEGIPELAFQYERAFKGGTKSRLAWVDVTEGATTRKIAPSWQDIDETVDTFALKASQELAGFNVKGTQQWEFQRAETFREEKSLSTNTSAATASQRKIGRASCRERVYVLV